ncbi:ABC transporter permease [Aestuariimicrobium sp. p3-SID1156]|uniref:ABC transporter permease n=1 Tax=Aestuariimicrobium sp. p3-SID1156 TaxID=2916038 RepID=UPI00223ABD3E|nr:ABC transporter permease [Aestuariimicrobium sp. p3-SID1156]MCT1459727.1 ABC transporter permease [Aestuariimicrobium sp. p3-SID1156]
MSIDFAPRPAPASPATRLRAQGALETSLMMRNGEQLLLALVIPIGLLVVGFTVGHRFGIGTAGLVGSVLALAIWSTAFTSTAIATGFDRRQGVLERMAATPLGRTGLLGGKAVAVVVISLLQWLVLLGVSLALGWRPRFEVVQTLGVLVAAVLAIVCFVSLALAMAGTLRAEATLGLANLVYLAGLALGIMVPPSELGSPFGDVVRWLPTSALADMTRAWTSGSQDLSGLLPLLLWALGSALLARKVFRWTS